VKRLFAKAALLAFLTAWAALVSLPAGIAAASEPLKTTLSPQEIQTLEKELFNGIPRYPYSVPDPDLIAYVPESFAMLTFNTPASNSASISRYYKREMAQRGWRLLDSWASSKRLKARHITLTFKKSDRIISVDITREGGKAQYALFTYSESGD
jgi:hypothetical protein